MNYKIMIVMGSISDEQFMKSCCDTLKKFKVPYKITVASAHRSPERVIDVIRQAEKDGAEVFIAAAGSSAHLAGVIASLTLKPVIGVPLPVEPFNGVDSLYSMVQMPPGIPVGVVSCGKSGAINSAILALRVLALNDKEIGEKLKKYLEEIKEKVNSDAEEIEKRDRGSS